MKEDVKKINIPSLNFIYADKQQIRHCLKLELKTQGFAGITMHKLIKRC